MIGFFENISTGFRAGILIGGLMLFWFIEGILPRYSLNYKKLKHALLNLMLTVLTLIVGFGLAAVLLETSDFTVQHNIGLLHLVSLPLWAEVIIGILLLDLIGAYFIHFIEHKIKWMWKFHLVHHSDTTVDVTTGLRHHPGETVFRIGFTILAVLIIGAPMGIIMLYQSLSVLFAHLSHANINVPRKLDKAVSYLFISPNMHKVHHHFEQPLTDTNFGNIFSIWDRLFGTYADSEKVEKLIYGIDTHMNPEENENFGNLLLIPFQKYRKPGAKP